MLFPINSELFSFLYRDNFAVFKRFPVIFLYEVTDCWYKRIRNWTSIALLTSPFSTNIDS